MIVGLYFIVVMTFLHGSGGDCGTFKTYNGWKIVLNSSKNDNIMISVVNIVHIITFTPYIKG